MRIASFSSSSRGSSDTGARVGVCVTKSLISSEWLSLHAAYQRGYHPVSSSLSSPAPTQNLSTSPIKITQTCPPQDIQPTLLEETCYCSERNFVVDKGIQTL